MSLTLAVRPPTARRAKICAIGTYVPPRLLTDKELEEMVETSDEWIYSRVGIRNVPQEWSSQQGGTAGAFFRQLDAGVRYPSG